MGPANDEEEDHEDENASKDGNSDPVALHQFPSIQKMCLRIALGRPAINGPNVLVI